MISYFGARSFAKMPSFENLTSYSMWTKLFLHGFMFWGKILYHSLIKHFLRSARKLRHTFWTRLETRVPQNDVIFLYLSSDRAYKYNLENHK